MGLRDTHAQIDADNRQIVLKETFGHLAPERNKTYRGRIVYAIGVYDTGYLNPTVIVSDWNNGLDDSPWFYDVLSEFLDELSWRPGNEYPKRPTFNDVGCIYEWTGTFKNYQFTGTVKKIHDFNKPKP